MENVQQSSNGSSFNEYNDINLTIRILFHGREVGNVIGKGGETVKNIRDQSGARVLISDGSTPERIVTCTGTTNAICKATELIGLKVEEFWKNCDWNGAKEPLTFKLIVPASQCGCIIGKGGCKIKEIRESNGAAVQVASDMLPYSTERLVSITGTTGTISQCVYQVCNVLLHSPPRGVTIPYDPRSNTSGFASSAVGNDYVRQCTNLLASLAALELGTASTGGINPAVALAGSQLRTGNCRNRQNRNGGGEHKNQNSNSKTEIISTTLPNDLIGCFIGRETSKIAEIHVELHKANLEVANSSSSLDDGSSSILPTPPTVAASPLSSAIPLAQLFAKPGAESKSDNSPPHGATIPYDPRSNSSGFASSAVGNDCERQRTNPLASLAALELGTASTGGINPAAALAESQLRTGNGGGEHKNQNSNSNTETLSMTIPNDLIECVIGSEGCIFAEIQQKSGAIVHIATDEGTHENEDRNITVIGNKDSISVAKNLIEMRYNFVVKFLTAFMEAGGL